MSSVGRLTWELCDLNQNVLGGGPITSHLPGAQVTIGREVARTASLTLDLDDDFAQLAQVGTRVLRCSVDGWTDPLFVGRVLRTDITYDGTTAQMKIGAADPLAHLEACLVFSTAVAMSPSAETFVVRFSATDPATMMRDLVNSVADNGHGIVNGVLDTGGPDLPWSFPAGSRVADALRSIAGLDDMPEFEIAPVFDNTGTLAELNTYHPRMGSNKTATILLRIGESETDDELLGFEVAPDMTGVVNRHVVIGDAPDGSISSSSASGSPKNYPRHPANRASHAGSISQYGVWETSESASGSSSASVLQRAAKSEVAANRSPITAFKVTLDPDTAPEFGPQGDFWIGDTIAVRVTTPKQNVLPYAGRVATASLIEVENGDVLVDLTAEPEDDAAGISTTTISVVVDSTEGTDPPPSTSPAAEVDPCAPVADTTPEPFCPNAGGTFGGTIQGKPPSGGDFVAIQKKKKKKNK